MNKSIIFLAALTGFGLLPLQAQVRIANVANNIAVTNSPAFIDASSNTTINSSPNVGKGLIFPRLDLSAMSSFPGVTAGIPNSFPTRFDGMIVYNTATSGTAGVGSTSGTLSPGFWFYENKSATNNGGTWKPMGTLAAAAVEPWYNVTTNTGATANTQDIYQMGKVGIGTAAPNSTLHTNGSFATRYIAVAANTTLDATHHTVNAVHNSGTVTLTLPPVTGITGRQYVVQNNGTGTTNVVVSGGGTIEGLATFTLNQVGQTAQLIAGNSEWQLVINAIKSASVPSGANIYTADGTLSGNRNVDTGGKNLFFTGSGNIGIGTTSPTAKLTIGGNILSSGDITATGNLATNSNIQVNGSGLVNGNLGAGSLTSGSTLAVATNMQVNGTGNVQGAFGAGSVTSASTVAVGTNLQVNGDAQINGKAIVNGSFGAGSLTSGSTLAVTTNMQVNGTGNVQGAFGAGSLTSASTAAVGTNLQVNGDTQINGKAIVNGSFGAGSLTSASTLAVSTNMQVNGNGQVNGSFGANSLTSATTVAVGTNLQVNGDGQVNGLFNVAGVLGGAKLTSGSTLAVQTNAFVGGYTEVVGYLKAANLIATAQTGFADRYAYFDLNGQLKAGIGYPSDIRLKENVTTIQNGLIKVLQLHPVTYDWKKDAQMNDHKQIGFIAQEIKKVVPEVVYIEERNGFKDLNTVNYEQLTALLTKAIQEQQEQIETLKKELHAIREEIEKLLPPVTIKPTVVLIDPY